MSGAHTPPSGGPAVSAVVVNHRRPELTIECVASLQGAFADLDGGAELIVVDNGSGDGSAERIAGRFADATVVALPDNRGFASAVNAGVERSGGEWVLLVNNDATVEPGAVAALLEAGRGAPDVGAVAAQMRFAGSPDVVNSAGIGVDRLGVAFDRGLGEPVGALPSEPFEVFGASGGAALLRRSMLDELDGLDPTFFFALEDADLAWRARMAGWRAQCAPSAVVWHHHGGTGRHNSAFKHYHVGLNRVRTLAKNADSRHLRRYGAAILAYEIAYLAYAVVADRTLAPLRGRLRGLREWGRYRRAGAPGRSPVELAPVRGLRAALRRRAAWGHGSDAAVEADRGSGAG